MLKLCILEYLFLLIDETKSTTIPHITHFLDSTNAKFHHWYIHRPKNRTNGNCVGLCGPTNRISQLLDKIMKSQNRNVQELRQLNLASKEISDQAAWPEGIYNPITAMGFQQCLPFSWTTLRGKHCQHPIAVMEVVDTFKLGILN